MGNGNAADPPPASLALDAGTSPVARGSVASQPTANSAMSFAIGANGWCVALAPLVMSTAAFAAATATALSLASSLAALHTEQLSLRLPWGHFLGTKPHSRH